MKILIFFALFILLCTTVFAAEWNGQEFASEIAPPDVWLLAVQEEFRSLGLSQEYVDEHLFVVEANYTYPNEEKSTPSLVSKWELRIKDVVIPFTIESFKIADDRPLPEGWREGRGFAHNFKGMQSLKEADTLVPLREVRRRAKKCLGDYIESFTTDENGDLLLLGKRADGGVVEVSLTSANVKCTLPEIMPEEEKGVIEPIGELSTSESYNYVLPVVLVLLALIILGLLWYHKKK